MAAAPTMKFTLCPPAPAAYTLPDEPAFGHDRDKFPVSAEVTADGWTSPGLGFDDYSRMSITTHKLASGRRFQTPRWAIDWRLLRKLLVFYFERRAFGLGRYPQNPSKAGNLRDRLVRACKVITARKPNLIARMDGLCAEYVACRAKNPTRARTLQCVIWGLDTQIKMADGLNGPAVVAQIVHMYYGAGLDSVGVCQELGVTPQHVRQTLKKLHDCWHDMTGERPDGSYGRGIELLPEAQCNVPTRSKKAACRKAA
jgi:hypothetical protein